MKKNTLCLLLTSGMLLCSCSSKASDQSEAPAESQPQEVPAPEEEPQKKDTMIIAPLEVKEFQKEVGDNKLELEYPTAGNPELVEGIRNWVNEQLGDTYRGNPDDAEAFFRHYAAQLGQDPDLNEYGGFTQDDFDVEYENDLVVTYEYTSYIYEGGAHGEGGSYGTTFLRSDGSIFGRDCFKSYRPMQQLFINGLKTYFKVHTDSELLECLIGVKDLSQLAPPGMKPWIEDGGVMFSYTPYEIAPYSSGSPRFVIPFTEIAPYLNEQGLKFFSQDTPKE